MKPLIYILLVFSNFTTIWAQTKTNDVSTEGDNSPAVIAKNFSATYGVRTDAIEAILWIYKAEGYDVERRKRATEQILKLYTESPEKQQKVTELSRTSRRKLGIINASEITKALEWDLFAQNHYLSTKGYNSPAVIAKGDVNIWYGIPPKILRALATQLEKNKIDIINFENKLTDQVKKYEELKIELETYSTGDVIYQQVEILLKEGKLKEAEEYIESDYYASKKRQAYKGYIFGKTKELLLKYEEAAIGYKDAIFMDKGNSKYHLNHAKNEITLARYDEAIKHNEIALRMDTLKIENDVEKAYLMNNLGIAWNSKGEYDKAIRYYENALKIFLITSGEQHPIVAITYNNLGGAWGLKGAYGKAIEYHEKALKIYLAIFDQQHSTIAINYNNLGNAWKSKGKYDKAIAYYEKAIEIDFAIFGEKHPTTANHYNNLGAAWGLKGEYDKAIEYSEKAFEIDFVIFGEKHPNVATDYNNLGATWGLKGVYDKAIEYHEKALKINLVVFGEKHPNVATDYNNLGVTWKSKGEYDKAMEYYEKALKINLVVFGEKHPNTATCYNNLGVVWDLKGNYKNAIEYYEKSQTILNQFFEPTHPYQVTTATSLFYAANTKGLELYNEKKYKEALGYFEKAFKNAEMTMDVTFSLTCLKNIGSSHKNLKNYKKGLLNLESGIQMAEQLNKKIDQQFKMQLASEILNTSEVQEMIAELKNLPLIYQMKHHKISCLKGLKRNREAEVIAKQLWQVGREAKDNRLLEDLRKSGYNFKNN